LCHSNDIKDCESSSPFKIMADESEKGFWRSMASFGKGMLSFIKSVPDMFRIITGFLKYII
jgi:hypothetical protein